MLEALGAAQGPSLLGKRDRALGGRGQAVVARRCQPMLMRATSIVLWAGLWVGAGGLPVSAEEPRTVPDPRWGAFFAGKDQRVPIEPTAWPWYAIGRVNIADSVSRRHCTGTLVGAQLVLTAGHCLYDHRLGRWVKPEHVHFVAGQARDSTLGHAAAVALI